MGSALRTNFDERRAATLALIVTEVLVGVWRQRLWFEPHWHAAALLPGCTRVRHNHNHHCNVAQ